MNRVIALDPVTGEELWSYDPQIDADAKYANDLVCRGVAARLSSEVLLPAHAVGIGEVPVEGRSEVADLLVDRRVDGLDRLGPLRREREGAARR